MPGDTDAIRCGGKRDARAIGIDALATRLFGVGSSDTPVLAAVRRATCPPRILEVDRRISATVTLVPAESPLVLTSLRSRQTEGRDFARSYAKQLSAPLGRTEVVAPPLLHDGFAGTSLGFSVLADRQSLPVQLVTRSVSICQPPHWRSTHRNRLHCAHGGKRRQRQQLHGPVKPRGLRLSKVIHQSPRSRGVKPRLPRERLPRRPCDHARRSPRCRRHRSRSRRRVPSAV